jgi:hypothetical protein
MCNAVEIYSNVDIQINSSSDYSNIYIRVILTKLENIIFWFHKSETPAKQPTAMVLTGLKLTQKGPDLKTKSKKKKKKIFFFSVTAER